MADDDENSEEKLLKISRRAHKLTQMVHSLPNSSNLDSHSRDLIRESFSSQQTMITLRKLQQASKIMYGVKERLKIDFSREKEVYEQVGSCNSLFARIDDLKKVIRESSYDQNFRIVSVGEKFSSSHSAQPQRPKCPSLIAKLMGLQELPSEANYSEQNKKCLVQPKSMLDIGMPKVRKLAIKEKNPELETERPKDIVEVGKSKVIMVTDKIKDSRSMSCYFDSPNDRNYHKNKPCSVRENKVVDSVQMLPRKVVSKEAKNLERNKAKASSDLSSRGLHQRRESVANAKENHNVISKPVKKGSTATKSQAKLSTRTPLKPESRIATTRSERSVSRSENVPKRHPQPSSLKTVSRNSEKSTVAKPVKRSMDIKAINGYVKNKDFKGTRETSNSPVYELPKQAEHNCKPFRKVTANNSKSNRSSTSSGAMQVSDKKSIIQRSHKQEKEDDIHQFFNSRSFVRHVQELFQLDFYATNPERNDKFSGLQMRNAKVIFDCHNELIVRKRHQLEHSNHAMLRISFRSLVVVSLDQLVEEISQGIDILNSYNTICCGTSLLDSTYVRLERDLMCKDMLVNAMWDVGWFSLVCVEEADLLVGQVEEQILCCLVEEIVGDLFVY